MANLSPETLIVFRKGTLTKHFAISGETTVLPSYAVDSDNRDRQRSANKWAKERGWWEKELTGSPSQKTIPNKGIQLTLLDLEFRGEGGRAYKVKDQHGHLFDLREDALVEAIALGGIEAGGKMGGTYHFILQGSQFKLVLEGGKLDTDARETEARKSTNVKKQTPFTLYSELRGDGYPLLYLGQVTSGGSTGHGYLTYYGEADEAGDKPTYGHHTTFYPHAEILKNPKKVYSYQGDQIDFKGLDPREYILLNLTNLLKDRWWRRYEQTIDVNNFIAKLRLRSGYGEIPFFEELAYQWGMFPLVEKQIEEFIKWAPLNRTK